MSKISDNIVGQIRESGIRPKPRWRFVLANLTLMSLVLAAVVVGGLVMSLVFLKIGDLDLELLSWGGERGLPMALEVLPLLWLFLLALLLLLAVWVFEKTEVGYRFRPIWLVAGSVLVSAVLGGLVYALHGPEMVDTFLRNALPSYHQMEEQRLRKFHLPELGVLPGRVVELRDGGVFGLEDMRRELWIVTVQSRSQAEKKFPQLRLEQPVLLMGEVLSGGQFSAVEIRMKRALPLPGAGVPGKGGAMLFPARQKGQNEKL